jgi:transcriptional regulator with XRE-family HTH domain
MGKAGQALRQVLEDYEISQTQLAEALGLGRSNVNRWVTETRDPTAETIVEVVRALKTLNSEAAQRFVALYLGDEV